MQGKLFANKIIGFDDLPDKKYLVPVVSKLTSRPIEYLDSHQWSSRFSCQPEFDVN